MPDQYVQHLQMSLNTALNGQMVDTEMDLDQSDTLQSLLARDDTNFDLRESLGLTGSLHGQDITLESTK